jgi:hypothetical protein
MAIHLPSAEQIRAVSSDELTRLWHIVLSPHFLEVVAYALQAGLPGLLTAPCAPDALDEAVRRHGGARADATLTLMGHVGLVEQAQGKWRLTPFGARFLAPDSPTDLSRLFVDHAMFLRGVPHLGEVLRAAMATSRELWSTRADPAAILEHFRSRLGFEEARRPYRWASAWMLARPFLDRDLTRHQVACDLGSGPGAFSAQMKRLFPWLRTIATDINFYFDEYRKRSEADLLASGERVELAACNVMHEALPPADLYTANRFLAGLTRADAPAWLRRVFEALPSGGRFCAVDFFRSGDPRHDIHTSQLFLYNISYGQSLLTENVHGMPTVSEVAWHPPWGHDELREVLSSVGFQNIHFAPMEGPMSYVDGRKP